MFGLVELDFRFGVGGLWLVGGFFFFFGGGVGNFLFIFHLDRLSLGCIPKFGFVSCLEVPKKFLWWVVVGGWLRVN